jgi:3-deoxy-D-manno-octulosonic-acid transferase
MWYFLYNVLLLLVSPVIVTVLLAKKRCRRGLLARLGLSSFSGSSRFSGSQPDEPENPVIWIHAVSLGEAVAVVPLVQELRRRYPNDRLIVSTVTETGRETVEQRLKGLADHCYAPLDFPWVVSRVVRLLNPRLFLFVETELWPNLLRTLHGRGVPCVMVNGRLSSRSFEGYRRIRPFMACVLSHVRLFLVQSDRDAARLVALGADPARVVRVGNLKFDQSNGPGVSQQDVTRASLGIQEHVPVLVAGSTHPVEEEALLAGYSQVLMQWPETVLVMAPRHIERASEVEAVARDRGFEVRRRSQMNGAKGWPPGGGVLILDTRGELALAYRLATVAYVGGTLAPVGGHNLLEPALWGKPVLFGPHTDHCEESALLLVEAGAGARVGNGLEFGQAVESLLRDTSARDRMGQAALRVMTENRGALQRSVELLQDILRRPPGDCP